MSHNIPKSLRAELKALVRAHVAKTLPIYLTSIGQPDVESARKLHAAMHAESASKLPWQLHAHPARVLYQAIAESFADAVHVDAHTEAGRSTGVRCMPFRAGLVAEAVRTLLKREARVLANSYSDGDVYVGPYISAEALAQTENAIDAHEDYREAKRAAKRQRVGVRRHAPGVSSDAELSDADSLDVRSESDEDE